MVGTQQQCVHKEPSRSKAAGSQPTAAKSRAPVPEFVPETEQSRAPVPEPKRVKVETVEQL